MDKILFIDILQRVHKGWVLQFHAFEAHLKGPSKAFVWQIKKEVCLAFPSFIQLISILSCNICVIKILGHDHVQSHATEIVAIVLAPETEKDGLAVTKLSS